MPVNNSHTVGDARLETSISFAASFAAEKLPFAMMSVTDWLGFSGSWREPLPNNQFSLGESE